MNQVDTMHTLKFKYHLTGADQSLSCGTKHFNLFAATAYAQEAGVHAEFQQHATKITSLLFQLEDAYREAAQFLKHDFQKKRPETAIISTSSTLDDTCR